MPPAPCFQQALVSEIEDAAGCGASGSEQVVEEADEDEDLPRCLMIKWRIILRNYFCLYLLLIQTRFLF